MQSLDAIPDTIQMPISTLESPVPRAQPRFTVPTHRAAQRTAMEASINGSSGNGGTRLDQTEDRFLSPARASNADGAAPPAALPRRALPPSPPSPTRGGGSKRPRDRLVQQPAATGQPLHPGPRLLPLVHAAAASVSVDSVKGGVGVGASQQSWGETALRREGGVIKVAAE